MNSTNPSPAPSPLDALDTIIAKAGGVTSLAAALGMTEGAVRYWKKRGGVPKQAARLLAYEAKHYWNLDVSPEDLTRGE
jgi:hypothetical protein